MDIRRALDLDDAAALIPEKLEPLLVELADKETPLRLLIDRRPWKSDTYSWTQRTALGAANAYSASDAFSAVESTYLRVTASMKSFRAEGAVDNIVIEASVNYIEALQAEIVGATKSLAHFEEDMIITGSVSDNAKEFNGLAIQCTSEYDQSHAVISFNAMDSIVQEVKDAGGTPALWVFSNRETVKLNQLARAAGTFDMNTVDVGHGNILQTYLGIPIVGSAFIPTNLAPTGYTSESYGFLLDTSEISMGVLKDVSYERVAISRDNHSFRLKVYECLGVRAPTKQRKIVNIAAS